jgi:phosphoribosylaminoimidazolecarboxamide formyltransferase/IMP cyclohydrolase
LRYGENPHQAAAFYRQLGKPGWWERAEILGGKAVSFNNLADTDAAWRLVLEFSAPACVIVKHANPCGVAIASDIVTAYIRAHECDPVSAFGGIVALNRPAPAGFAEALGKVFTEVVIAPDYEPAALAALQAKNKGQVRVVRAPTEFEPGLDVRSAGGGFLVQEADDITYEGWRVVTQRQPTEQEWADLRFAWAVGAHTRSNSIVLAKDGQAFGIGAGDQSRVGAAQKAAAQAAGRAKGGVAASEALFPFPDGVETCVEAGAAAIVQPGGSVKDDEVIARADELGVAMVFTGRRHFRHA